MNLGIAGKNALVSGASRGLGKACALALAQEGVNVTIVARTPDILERTGVEIAKATGKTVPQIALNWLLQRPTVSTVVIGARNEEQLKANLGVVGWSLTPGQVAKLDKASERPLAYPYWHQTQFAERNPFPV